MDNRDALRSAVLAGTQLGAPTSSPLGDFPELRALYNVDFASPAVKAASQASGYNTDITVQNQEAAAREAKANAIDEAKAKLSAIQDAADPSKAQRIPKEDGGFAFVDGAGKEISAWQYARMKGQQPHDVLKGSFNPIDKSFAQDYKQFNQYFQDKQQSNPKSANFNQKAADRAASTEQRVKDAWGVDLHKTDIKQLWSVFQNAYPTVFGLHSKGPQGTGQFLPSNQALDEQANGISSVQAKKNKNKKKSGGGSSGHVGG